MKVPTCNCTFEDECSGTGVLHCSPPCGGDNCICTCGGEADCDGCSVCDTEDHDDGAAIDFDYHDGGDG